MPHKTTSGNISSISATIARLLSHYWTAADPVPARRAQFADWLEDLTEFEPSIVADACRTWRRSATATRRPLPTEIRKLCLAEQSSQQERRAIAGPTDMDEYARSVGWPNNAERMEAIRRDEAKRNDPTAWARLKQIDDEIKFGRSGSLRQAAAPAGALAAALGVTAREVTPEEMRRSQIELGIEPPDDAWAAAEEARRDSISEAREPYDPPNDPPALEAAE